MDLKKGLKSNFSIIAIERVFGKVINSGYFFLIAILIPKEDLGVYVWVISIVGVLTGLLTGGIGKVLSRRIAIQPNLFGELTSSYVRFYSYLLIVPIFSLFGLFFFDDNLHLYLYLGGVHAFTSVFVLVFKESFVGLEKFTENSKATVLNILSKAIIGISGVYLFRDAVIVLLVALILSNLVSFLYYLRIARKKMPEYSQAQFNPILIKSVFRESLPLIGVILFDSALSRFDTILLGSISSMEITGDYNFAYKIYEISWLPFTIIGTLIFPPISRFCRTKNTFIENQSKIYDTAKGVILMSIIIPFVICLFWTPIMEFLTRGKYGSSNQHVIEILSLAIPFVAVIGLHWNILMGLQRGKIILMITIITATLNIALNFYLIGEFGAIGAAVTNLISNVIQLGLYIFFVAKISMQFKNLYGFVFKSVVIATFAYYIIAHLNPWISIKIIFVFGLLIAAYFSNIRLKILAVTNEA